MTDCSESEAEIPEIFLSHQGSTVGTESRLLAGIQSPFGLLLNISCGTFCDQCNSIALKMIWTFATLALKLMLL